MRVGSLRHGDYRPVSFSLREEGLLLVPGFRQPGPWWRGDRSIAVAWSLGDYSHCGWPGSTEISRKWLGCNLQNPTLSDSRRPVTSPATQFDSLPKQSYQLATMSRSSRCNFSVFGWTHLLAVLGLVKKVSSTNLAGVFLVFPFQFFCFVLF